MWIFVAIFGILSGTAALTKSHVVIYYCKYLYFLITCSVVSLYMMPIFLLRPRDVRNTGLGFPILNLALKPLGIEWKISGRENLTKSSACMIICNHQSILDFMLPLELSPEINCALVAKKSILYAFPFGPAAWLCGGIFIDRAKGKESRSILSSNAKEIHKNQVKMWMFPEGTRSKKSKLLDFKKGAFQVAVQNDLPIVPIIISPYNFVDDDHKVFKPGKLFVSILPPIKTSSEDNVTKLTEKCRDSMNNEFQRLSILVHNNSF